MAELFFTEEMVSYLAAQGLVRPGNVAGSLPPCWTQLRYGLPQPNRDSKKGPLQDTVLEIVRTAGMRSRPYLSWLEEVVVEVTVRSITSVKAELLQAEIRRVIDDKRSWEMGALHVEWSYVWRWPFWLGSDSVSFDLKQSFRVCATRASLQVA